MDYTYPLIWLAAILIFSVAEAVSFQLITIWFAAGALISLILSLLGVPVYLQVIIFLAVSVVLVFATRPLYNKYVKPRMVKTNVDSLIGEQGVVKQDIVNDDARGLVKVNGQTWSARSCDGNIIKEGQKVEILSIEGVKLIVRSVG